MSSSSSSESNGSPAPTRKRKHVEADSLDSSTPDEDAGSADEDTPQPQPPATEDSTVLSHAERRRQKKRQRQHLATASSEAPRKRCELADETATTKLSTESTPAADDSTRQKRQHSVWIGNLSFRTTQDALRGFFNGVGMITRIHMPMRRGKETQGENMGCVTLPLLLLFSTCIPPYVMEKDDMNGTYDL